MTSQKLLIFLCIALISLCSSISCSTLGETRGSSRTLRSTNNPCFYYEPIKKSTKSTINKKSGTPRCSSTRGSKVVRSESFEMASNFSTQLTLQSTKDRRSFDSSSEDTTGPLSRSKESTPSGYTADSLANSAEDINSQMNYQNNQANYLPNRIAMDQTAEQGEYKYIDLSQNDHTYTKPCASFQPSSMHGSTSDMLHSTAGSTTQTNPSCSQVVEVSAEPAAELYNMFVIPPEPAEPFAYAMPVESSGYVIPPEPAEYIPSYEYIAIDTPTTYTSTTCTPITCKPAPAIYMPTTNTHKQSSAISTMDICPNDSQPDRSKPLEAVPEELTEMPDLISQSTAVIETEKPAADELESNAHHDQEDMHSTDLEETVSSESTHWIWDSQEVPIHDLYRYLFDETNTEYDDLLQSRLPTPEEDITEAENSNNALNLPNVPI